MIAPLLDAATAEKNMAALAPCLSDQEAQIEAARCLFCFDAPCIAACPTGIDIPSFIRKITTGNFKGSARTILSANVLGASCGRVCPTEVLCEGACVVLAREGKAVEIGRLQTYAVDRGIQQGATLKPGSTRSGKRVAVIGAGPAGLSCAAELAQLGHSVTVYERRPLAGGLNTYGVAYYKMQPSVSLAEVELIRSLGVEIRCGVEIGKDIAFDQLRSQSDALFIGTGLGASAALGIPGEDLPEVLDALSFIESVRSQPLHAVPLGKRVIVIGGGNTAIDAVVQAKKLGAEQAVLVYRRRESDMPAYRFEVELARSAGVEFRFQSLPTAILGSDGHVTGIQFARTEIDSSGKARVLPGTEQMHGCDMVLKAVGQPKPKRFLEKLFPGMQFDAEGLPSCSPFTGETSMPGVFIGGDCANGGREVVHAVAGGRDAARGIHLYLTGQPAPAPSHPSRLGLNIEAALDVAI